MSEEKKLNIPPKNIKLVLFDMDLTILDIHTRGVWNKEISRLAKHVMPAFKTVVPELIDQGFLVGIVTFSDEAMSKDESEMSGTVLVKALLEEIFPEIHEQIYIAARFPRNNEPQGKRWHLEQIQERLEKTQISIKPNEVILFDDTKENVEFAKEDGIHGFLVDRGLHFTLKLWNSACNSLV